MSEITLAEASTHLTAWKAADLAVAKGQSYTIGDRTLTRVHSADIRKMINYWSRTHAQLTRVANGGSHMSMSRANLTK